ITESGTFRKSGYGWSACDGEIFAKIDGEGVLSSANLYWTCVDYNKDIWLIGASYFSLNDPARWPYYLYADKYDKNVFMAGRGGMGGPHGIEELKDALKSGFSPKALAWGVGMNDGSDEGDIKPAYYDALCELMQVCKERDIMLYVMTIPQTPKQNNSYKLDYVMNRKGEFAKYNYRVINIARSINAHTVGSEWYEGMIHSDQTHPTTLGARSFYLQFLCDFPELMVGGSAKRVHKKVETLAVGQALSISGEGKSKDEFAVTFSADFTDEFVGKLVLGGTKNGQTYVTIDKKFVKVYAKSAEKDVLLTSVPTSAKMQDIVNVRVHVVGNKANIALASAGELLTMKKNSIFSFETYWSAGEEVTLSCEGQELQNVDMKYVNN
ncbi:MAG: hypothetical protein J6Q68_00905, partial [Clostridia bacterium]|nr:hypothetical protein [Clostridia bacterium]